MSDRVSQRELARRLNVNPAHINRLVKKGVIEVVGGLIDPEKAFASIEASRSIAHGYLDEVNARQRGDEPPKADNHSASTVKAQFDKARAMREAFAASMSRLQYDKQSGAVVLVADVARLVSEEYANVRRRLLAIPAEQAPRVLRATTVIEMQQVLEDIITEALEGLTRDKDFTSH